MHVIQAVASNNNECLYTDDDGSCSGSIDAIVKIRKPNRSI